MDKPNLFTEDTDFNICLSWLCDSTSGGTYSIGDWFGKKLKCPEGMDVDTWNEYMYDVFNWQVWEDTIGWKHDYRVDDPKAAEEARNMAEKLNILVDLLNRNPDYRNWSEDFLKRAKLN